MRSESELDKELKGLHIDRMQSSVSSRGSSVRWVGIVAVAALALGVAVWLYARTSVGPSVQVERVVRAQPVAIQEGSVVLNATGYIVAHHEIEVASKIIGKVAWIGVEEGDRVQEGQPIVRLEDTEYRAQVEQAKGNYANLAARLTELEHGSRPQEIAEAKDNLSQVEADLSNAELTFGRRKVLLAEGVVSRQDFDAAQDNYRNLQAKVGSLQQTYDLEKIGPRQEEIEAMKGLVEQAKGVLAYDQEQLNNTVIRAPIEGTILARAVEQGEYVTNGFVGDRGAKGYVVTLADLKDLQVEIDISQNDFAKLHMRQNGIVTTDAYPDRKYDGELAEISPKADRHKATVQVKVHILHPDAYLRPDMNASVAFIRPRGPGEKVEAHPLITIPASALQDGKVFLAVDGRAHEQKVQTSRTTPDGIQIGRGLVGGERLIVNPPRDLKDGQKIHVEGQTHE